MSPRRLAGPPAGPARGLVAASPCYSPSVSPSVTPAPLAGPRWHSHAYNRADLYRLAGGLGWLPRRFRLALARALGRLAARLMPAERDAVRRTLARVTGAGGSRLEELAVGTFADFAMCFSDLISTNRQSAEKINARVRHLDGVEPVAQLNAGLVSLTAHVGNWEMAGRLLAGRAGRPTHVVVAEEEASELERWVRRDGGGVRFVTRSRPTVSLELVAALRRGEVVAVQGDRALGTRGDVPIPFFGLPAPFPLGPFVLAAAVGVPLVPAFCLLDSSREYVVKVSEPLVVRRGGEEDAARAWVAILEGVVRERPTQWFNFFDIWNPLPSWAGPRGRRSDV
ncbi:MAG TPA: lysophospholipid acyltransferase family protein [Candidatus Methylomirabilis sp.]|nr:lysophospholipid acyltransferase family protein [Candidatus Methylomirabilis sp.]